jgi:ADP-dependent NAD(P)H-hydrate dehydratase / NAD(P)H-hydrate epimerase
VVGILAGSDRFTGAATLAVGGALRGGAGMIRLVSAESAVAVVRQRWPETVITVTGGSLPAREEIKAAGRVQAWVAGPGMGTDEEAHARLAAVLATDVPVLVDADGLTLVAADKGMLARSAPTLLTPHAGELGRLLGVEPADVEARRLEHARMAAAELGATVLVKGSTTVIAAADGGSAAGPALVNLTGTSWLATAGTGDVLSGLAGSLLAQGLSPEEAAGVAAYLHGLAARLAAAGTGGGPGPAEGAWGGAGGRGSAGGRGARGAADAPIGAHDVIDALPAAIRAARQAHGVPSMGH